MGGAHSDQREEERVISADFKFPVADAVWELEKQVHGLRKELAERPDDYVSTEVYDQVYLEREELQQQVKTLVEELVRVRNERRNFQIKKIENGARAERAERELGEEKAKVASLETEVIDLRKEADEKEWVAAEPQTFDYKRAYQELKKQFPSEDQERINRQAAEITRLLEAKEQLKGQVAKLEKALAGAHSWNDFHRKSADNWVEAGLERGKRIKELESKLALAQKKLNDVRESVVFFRSGSQCAREILEILDA